MLTRRRPSVLLVSGCKAGTTFQYRVLQKQEQLRLHDIETTIYDGSARPESILADLPSHEFLYLYRVAYNPAVDRLVSYARAHGIPVIFGVDDLVFEPDLAHHVDPLKTMPDEQAVLYYEGVWRYRQTLLVSDFVVASTEYLADRARKLGKTAFVHRNGLSHWMIEQGRALAQQPRREPSDDLVVLGYGSGTDTHRKDLAEIALALSQILQRHPEVELHIVGPIELPDALKGLEGRIRHRPLVGWREWLSVLNTFDVNLASLESENPFCEAKSEIKYTEAAILGIPTVASRADAYTFAIRDGETGFLAASTEEWIAKLERLVTDPVLRRRVGLNARADVLARYTPEILGKKLVGTLDSVSSLYSSQTTPASDGARGPRETPLVLNWIFPEPMTGSGGHTNIIRMINLLASFGHRTNAYVVPGRKLWDKNEWEIREFLQREFGHLEAGVFKWNGGSIGRSDAVILTYWATAYLIEDAVNTSQVFYFVQDWEPFFFPMGTQYLRAEQTYKMGFPCITLGPWLTERLRSWYNADADYFDFAVDHSIYYPRLVERPERPRVCFYARPSTPRRLFPMGVEALQLVHERRPDVEIVFYGVSDADLREQRVPFPHTNRGILSEEELAELFSSSTVGIVLSSTNCSLVPPEMMACKCAVVDLNRETVQGVLEHEVNALLTQPTPEDIADTVIRLIEDDSLRERLVDTAYQQVQERSWTKSARAVEGILYDALPPSRCAWEERWPGGLWPLPVLADFPEKQQQLLNAVHGRRRRTIARWRARLRRWKRQLLPSNWGVALNGKSVRTVGELVGRCRIGQSFVARRDNLHRIDLLVGTHGRRNTRDVTLHLKESPGAAGDLATASLNASLLVDMEYARFEFEPQPDSRDKSYYLWVESPESVSGDAITLWAYGRVDLPHANLYRNGRPVNGQLVMGLYYLDQQLGEVGERPLLQDWTRVAAQLSKRLRKARRILLAEGLRGLRHELMHYWKWKADQV